MLLPLLAFLRYVVRAWKERLPQTFFFSVDDARVERLCIMMIIAMSYRWQSSWCRMHSAKFCSGPTCNLTYLPGQ